MNDIDKIQKEILELAYKTFSKITTAGEFSYPLIPLLSEEYFKNRVVILGQETNTWRGFVQNSKDKQVYQECLDEYDRFVRKEVLSYKGKFWEFSRSLYSKNVLKGTICKESKLSHCWMNLFCLEKSTTRNDKKNLPSQNREVANQVIAIQKKFVFEVLKMIQPKVILALIGNKNDDILEKYVLGAEKVDFKPIDLSGTFDQRQLAEIEINDDSNPLKDTLIIRTYHPTYFMWRMRGKDKRELYQKVIYKEVEKGLS